MPPKYVARVEIPLDSACELLEPGIDCEYLARVLKRTRHRSSGTLLTGNDQGSRETLLNSPQSLVV